MSVDSVPRSRLLDNNRPLTCWLAATAFTIVTAVSAQAAIPLPFTPVPVTMQVFAVLLSGLLLGRRWGAVAQAQYVALGAAGLPIFALHHGGSAVVMGVTGGYLLSYPIAACIAGSFGGVEATVRRQGLACALAIAWIYGVGCVWLAMMSRPMLSPGAALIAGAGWFVFWDAAKAMAAIGLANRLRSRPRDRATA